MSDFPQSVGHPRAILADDEPLLRAQLRGKLAKLWPELQIAAEAATGSEALAVAAEHAADIVFLDIHMPVMSGLDAARSLIAAAQRPLIVFVTAWDQYAVEAFEQGAIDYVLKPWNEQRLSETIRRLQERLRVPPPTGADPQLAALTAALQQLAAQTPGAGAKQGLRWIRASVGQTVRLIAVNEVIYFQSDEKYTRVVLDDSEVLIRKPIKELLAELDPEQFWQIHRSTVVNTRHIAAVVRGVRDQADLKLKGRSETLTVSRNFTHLFKQM